MPLAHLKKKKKKSTSLRNLQNFLITTVIASQEKGP
jgi:hypothetical protein